MHACKNLLINFHRTAYVELIFLTGPTDDEEVVAYCSDSFSSDFSSDDENDENVNDSLLHNKVHNKKKCHKNKLSFAKLFHLDQQKKVASGKFAFLSLNCDESAPTVYCLLWL